MADECVAGSIVLALRDAGLDVAWIRELAPGSTDEQVLAQAWSENRGLLTEDKDFGELTVRFGRPCRGVILLVLSSLDAAERAPRALAALTALGDKAAGHFVVVEPRRIRLRPLATHEVAGS